MRTRRAAGGAYAGTVVAITGASSGVGRAVARAFGAAGARIGLIARGEEGLEAARREIAALGGDALVLPLDVGDAAAVDRAADAIVERWGALDIWINDAMLSVFAPVVATTAAEYRRVTEVTYLGAVHGTKAALRHMWGCNRGTIIQIGSALAYRSIPLQSAYCASKAALRGFTDSLRSELIHERRAIRLSMLHLPAVNTPQFNVVRNKLGKHPRPVGYIFQPEVIARALLRVAHDPPREMWIGWPASKAIIGQRLIPGRLDRYLAHEAWEGQFTDELPPERRDNFAGPLPGDRGAHGPFDDHAHARSKQEWLRRHGRSLAATATVSLAALGAAALLRGR